MSALKPSNLCLLIYLDETGQEELKDQQYPIFGIGGCAVLCQTTHRLLDKPWREMKKVYFGNEDFSFHASSTLASATAQQRSAICHFFKNALISRFAAILRVNTVLSPELIPYQVISSAVFSMIGKICIPYPLDSIALIYESSQRGNPLFQRWFTSLRIEDEHRKQLPIHFCVMDKTVKEPGLEIADCVINTAGRHVKHFLKTGQNQPNDLYSSVFQSVHEPLVQFIDVHAALVNEEPTKPN